MIVHSRYFPFACLSLCVLLAACSGDEGESGAGTGGISASGGATSTGGNGTGGATSTGGDPQAGTGGGTFDPSERLLDRLAVGSNGIVLERDGTPHRWSGLGDVSPDFVAHKYTTVAMDGTSYCGVTTTGDVRCDSGEAREGDYVMVTMGNKHACALTSAGKAECWGEDDHGSVDQVPGDTVIDVTVGRRHTCVAYADRPVVCVGHPDDVAETPNEVMHRVFARDLNTCGTRPDGTFICWGLTKTQSGEVNGFIKVQESNFAACALKDDQSLQCWKGGPEESELEAHKFREFDLAGQALCAITTIGNLLCWPERGAPSDLDL